ncbi:MerR family transcriptional regulator [Listeria sp. PSOL-1]|uniref:MerR family transcriptional regulator n=1 Tax=Listeria sp. PSOL-1 TaxID=1844999 RepID=UPI0013D37EDC|nr:MerR family transcriptional regulator [Listeria sp. PSOL-1]
MTKLLTIGEMAKLSEISIQRLRYYDQISLFSPAEIDNKTGYRYYQKEQTLLLHIIQMLQYTGLSLKEIKQLLLHPQKNAIQDQLALNLQSLEAEERKIKRKKWLIHRHTHYVKLPFRQSCENFYPDRYFFAVPSDIHKFNNQDYTLLFTALKAARLSKSYKQFISYYQSQTENFIGVDLDEMVNSPLIKKISAGTFKLTRGTKEDLEHVLVQPTSEFFIREIITYELHRPKISYLLEERL